jgi:hypothetical protein
MSRYTYSTPKLPTTRLRTRDDSSFAIPSQLLLYPSKGADDLLRVIAVQPVLWILVEGDFVDVVVFAVGGDGEAGGGGFGWHDCRS